VEGMGSRKNDDLLLKCLMIYYRKKFGFKKPNWLLKGISVDKDNNNNNNNDVICIT